MNLSTRQQVEELMDQPGLDEREHQQALAGLKRVNWISGSSSMLWPPLRQLAQEHPDRPLKVLDVASGGGDVVINLAQRAKQEQIPMEFSGSDISPVAVDYATRQATERDLSIPFHRWDVLKEPVPGEYDVIMCSLFLHHLRSEEAIFFLNKISYAARQLVLVNDLRRSRFGYCLAQIGCRLLSRSPIVHVDGPLSVRSAFTIKEAIEHALKAGMESVTVTRHWPERFLLSWRNRT
ncbi:hypothetical protein Pla110_03060 [Polystyrenella longa]|uniref:Methyltransferase domain-containing protein n=1 Tax=Polystyrenella longa TaxID=2528007 RepID=A0A518CH99_9PLAN|nr:methyltransferase domain-containing protein [Polystyrenella longa]QDU78602.1 hypothetical protein Pla110_03060 [Polystyrenella longa]